MRGMRKRGNSPERQEKSYDTYLFHNMVLWLTVPLLIMAIIIYSVYFRGENNKSRLVLQSYSMQMQDIFNHYLTDLKEYYLDVINEDSYQQMNQMTNAPFSDIPFARKQQTLLSGGRIEGYVNGYTYVNLRNEWVLSNCGMYSYEKLRDRETLDSFLEERKTESSEIEWVNYGDGMEPNQTLPGYGELDFSGVLMLMKTYSRAGELESVLAVQLNMSYIQQRVEFYESAGYEILWMNGADVLFETSPEIADLLQSALENRETGDVVQSGSYLVTASFDESNGMSCLFGYDTSRDRREITTALLLAGAFLICYVVLMYFLRRKSSVLAQPFLRMKETKEEQEQHIRTLFVTNLLKGEINSEAVREMICKYRYPVHPGFRMMFIRLKGEELPMEQVLAGIPSEIREMVYITPVIYRDSIAMIIGGDEEYQVEYQTATVFKAMEAYAVKEYGCTLLAGISRHFTDLSLAMQAGHECHEVLLRKAREETDDYSLGVYDDFELLRGEKTASVSSEDEFYEAVSSCNEEEAVRLLIIILDQLDQRKLWGEHRAFYVYRLLIGLLEIPEKEVSQLSEIFERGQLRIFEWKDLVVDRKKLQIFIIEEMIRPIIAELQKCQSQRDSEIVRKMMKVIRERGGNVTLTECAEVLNYHPGYLSRVLRQEKNVSFLDMVNAEKLKMAKHLLVTTKLSIAEVSEQLGYNNVQNFIRFFKNQTNLTPAQFRKEARDEHANPI